MQEDMSEAEFTAAAVALIERDIPAPSRPEPISADGLRRLRDHGLMLLADRRERIGVGR